MSIEKVVFSKKIVDDSLQDIFYAALEKFPELHTVCMIVKESKFYGIQHTLRSYPPLLSLPSPRRRRVYPIVINTNKKTPIPFHSLTRDEQIGSMAHELAHTLDYTRQTSLRIIKFSLLFWISKNFVTNLEHRIDKTVIERGFGPELLQYRERVEREDRATYSRYREVYYMNSSEIRTALNGSNTNEQPKKQLQLQHFKYPFLHSAKTFIGFFPGIWEMIVLIYFKKVHKKI